MANLYQTQERFVAHLRDPQHQPPPADVQPERIAAYRQLLFNNVDGFLTDGFPVLRTLHSSAKWRELVQDFFCHHSCTSPYFCEISKEFLGFLQQRKVCADYPFMQELAHYEWVELALSLAKDEVIANPKNKIATISCHNLSLSKLAMPLAYKFAVHKISRDYMPKTTPNTPTYLLVYRDSDYRVNFTQLAPLSFVLLNVLQENNNINCTTCLQQIATAATQLDSKDVMKQGLQAAKELAAKNVISIGE